MSVKKYRDEQGRIIFGTTFIKAFRDDSACPKKLLEYFLLGNFSSPQTEAMLKGNYFEYLCLGATADDQQIPELPRLKAKDKDSGEFKKSTDHLRIDAQAKLFPDVLSNYKIIVTEVQKSLRHEMGEFVIATKADIFGSIHDPENGFVEEAYVDLKLTKDINNTFGDFQWHDPETRDHTQAFLTVATHYKMTGRIAKFYYLVFDYKEDSEHILVEKRVTANDIFEFFETVRTIIEKIAELNEQQWPTNPSWNNCENCLLKSGCQAIPPRKPIRRV